MPYIPLNKVQTNLYTAGEELVLSTTSEYYVGYYHRYYDGRAFTGKTPDAQFKVELITPAEQSNFFTETDTLEVFTEGRGLNAQELTLNWNLNTVSNYLKSRNATVLQPSSQILPTPFIPTPAPDDYTLGEIIRYFVKKSNELRYIEINSDTYNSLVTQDSNYAWQFYLAIKLPWQISGNKEEVGKVNRNMVLLTEQRNKIRGLQEFLRFDYLKFYKS